MPKRRRKRNPEGLSAEAWELILYAENERSLQNQRESILKNIIRKVNRGAYDASKAPRLWQYWFDNAAKAYTKEFDTGRGFGIFTPQIRREAAAWYAPREYQSVLNGEYEFGTLKVKRNPMAKKRKRKATPAQLRALKKGRATLKKKRGKKKKKKTKRRRNPAYGNYARARAVARGSRAVNPVRKLTRSRPGYRGYVVASFKPGTELVEFWDGKKWGRQQSAATYSNPENGRYVASKGSRFSAVAPVTMAPADIRLKLLGQA